MPGYQENKEAREAASSNSPTLARLNGTWDESGNYKYSIGGKSFVYDVKANKVSEVKGSVPERDEPTEPTTFGPRVQARGRQAEQATSKNGDVAKYADGNIFLTKSGGQPVKITDGDPAKRVKFGTASWVYGEELEQRDAFGFSPDGRYLWFYRFDESKVLDYHVLLELNTPQSKLYTEAYPKPGQPNPEVDLFVYDLKESKTIKVPVRSGAFTDAMGHYVYAIWWSSSDQLCFQRMNRAQTEMELVGFAPSTGALKRLYRESTEKGWVEFSPLRSLTPNPDALGEGKLLTKSEASGFMNLVSIDLVKGGATPITTLKADVIDVVRIDDKAKTIDFMAATGNGPYFRQLHRIGWDGKGEKRITDPSLHHQVAVHPEGKLIIDLAQTASQPPVLRALDSNGKVLSELAKSDVSGYLGAGFSAAEELSFTARDGKTELITTIHKPRNFDPKKKYPMILQVYGGPLGLTSGTPGSNWRMSAGTAHYGFIVAEINTRGTNGRGRAFRQVYDKAMGIHEIDDMADAVKAIVAKGYVDPQRVGIEGTSYGGYASAMAIGRYPDVFRAACVQSMVSDWRNYDTTYTERYMGLFPEQEAAYKAGSTLTYAKDTKGWVLIYFGSADDNTHMTNAFQYAEALRRARVSYEMQVGTDQGHSGLGRERMMEFFIERLVMNPNK